MTTRDRLRLPAAILASAVPALAVMVPLILWLDPSPAVGGVIGILFGCAAVVAGNVWYFVWLDRQR